MQLKMMFVIEYDVYMSDGVTFLCVHVSTSWVFFCFLPVI